MNILALDTSTEYCSVAVWQDGAVQQRVTHAGQTHSTILLEMVDGVLQDGGLHLAALDGIAYGAGPGSFTGLRIACATAQGLAYASGIPLAGIGTLQALAAGSGAARVICCLDARMQEIYHAAYVCAGNICREVSAPRVCAPDAAPRPEGGGWTGCGSGFAAYRDVLAQRYGIQLAAIDGAAYPQARIIAQLAAPVFAGGGGIPAEQAAPLYVRDRVALKTAER